MLLYLFQGDLIFPRVCSLHRGTAIDSIKLLDGPEEGQEKKKAYQVVDWIKICPSLVILLAHLVILLLTIL